MSISSVSSASANPAQSFNQTNISKDFAQLSSALQSGDLAAAQSAYNSLEQSPLAQGNGPVAKALQQIGQDLKSGDTADAKKALATLKQQMRGHHHHGGGDEQTTQATSNNAVTTAPTVIPSASSNSVNISA
jgi:hypothetical protein